MIRAIRALLLLGLAWLAATAQEEPGSWQVLGGSTTQVTHHHNRRTVMRGSGAPAWRVAKDTADKAAAAADNTQVRQALSSYSQLLQHGPLYADMPLEVRYDVHLRMARLLKQLGLHRRAELLLYEAMSYNASPYEAHLQLGLLALDKEDLREAKMHLKNCLHHKSEDVSVLAYLSVVLVAEGRDHEAKFFVSRLLSALEVRVRRLLHLMGRHERDIVSITAPAAHADVFHWLENMIAKALHGQLQVTPSAHLEMIRMFSNLYTFLTDGILAGRLTFDLGQSLYEGGRPSTGYLMMQRGHETQHRVRDGGVSVELVRTRIEVDFPVVPTSSAHLVGRFLNLTSFLANSAPSAVPMEIENILDIYWPLPLLGWSGLGVAALHAELLGRFSRIPERRDAYGRHFLRLAVEAPSVRAGRRAAAEDAEEAAAAAISSVGMQELGADYDQGTVDVVVGGARKSVPKNLVATRQAAAMKTGSKRVRAAVPGGTAGRSVGSSRDADDEDETKDAEAILPNPAAAAVEVGVFGGHMSSHPVGHAVLSQLLAFSRGQAHVPGRPSFRLSLVALPLVPDTATRRIAQSFDRIINLPVDLAAAWAIIEGLHLDVLLVPDWQPFPDTHSVLFASARIAPVQACFYVRGSPCPASASMDYYLLPEELADLYLRDAPAVAPRTPVDWAAGARGDQAKGPGKTAGNSSDSEQSAVEEAARTRLQWLAAYTEQVVLVSDWPLVTGHSVREIAAQQHEDEENDARESKDSKETKQTSEESLQVVDDLLADTGLGLDSASGGDGSSAGPLAVLPVHPSQLHPLMDDLLVNVMQAAPKLRVVLVLPASYFSHSRSGGGAGDSGSSGSKITGDSKMCWARALVRRLWQRESGLHHRLRLLPSPLTDARMLRIFRQADLVLDAFPVGIPAAYLSLALSVGTPVVTMRTGTSMQTSSAGDTSWLRRLQLQQELSYKPGHPRRHAQQAISSLFQGGVVPWRPTVSAVHAFYRRAGLEGELAAASRTEYFAVASRLSLDPEHAYRLRVRILEAVDAEADAGVGSEGARGLWEFVYRVGTPWARERVAFLVSPTSFAAVQADADEARVRRRRSAAATE